ncbi:MAG: leucine-rich repeat domain-containing protein, partial [Lewinella sp.]|nr:leucine-rich repeat domain-containing protein [Lewinella sp.]
MTCRDLHSALARPELVRQLDLRRQGLHSIADVPWERFTQLSSLDLSDNQLRFLPKRMQALTGLRSLFLGKNRFSSLPDWLPELRSLRQLSASRNRLHDLPELPAELEILDLQQNKLKDVPPAVLACPRLLNLYLGKNPFQEITATLTGLTQLRILDLSHCGLHHLPALPVSLSRLDAPHNKLETLASNWTQLARLEKIDLAHNPIVLATEDFVHFPGLRFLH